MSELPDLGYPFVSRGYLVDTTNNILINGEFDAQIFPWEIDNYNGGTGSISVVSDANMSGANALQICLSEPGTERWHVQVSQNAPFEAGKSYEIAFMAKADEAITIAVTMQQAGSPYAQYMEEAINLTTENQSFSFPFKPDLTMATNKLKFFLGLNTTCLYLDSIIFKEVETTGIRETEDFHLISLYPNPVTSGMVSIESTTGDQIKAIEILDLKGTLLKALTPHQAKTEVEVSSFNSGMYFVRIRTEKSVVSKKIVIQ